MRNWMSRTRSELRMQMIFAFALPFCVLWPNVSWSDLGTWDTCDQSAVRAAQTTGVPVDILRAITRAETGRTWKGAFRPWPWTINMEGEGVWFDDRISAHGYALEHFNDGARSFDVGCFQLNYRWHHQNFSSLQDMFDPDENALYAARFLSRLYKEFGDWSKAAGAYHSRTPKFAQRYRTRFDRVYAQLVGAPTSQAPELSVASETPEPGPFVVAAGKAGLGSLVASSDGVHP